jgi:hypothetical protein
MVLYLQRVDMEAKKYAFAKKGQTFSRSFLPHCLDTLTPET